jgi:hypothetical protein
MPILGASLGAFLISLAPLVQVVTLIHSLVKGENHG